MRRSGRRIRLAILGHTGRPAVRRQAARLLSRLRRSGNEVRLDERLAAEMGLGGHPLQSLAQWCGILLSLGGDGTALAGARALAGRRGTLLPVNLGDELALSPAPEPLLAPPQGRRWEILWSSEDPRYGGSGWAPLDDEERWRLAAHAACVARPGEERSAGE